AGRVFVEDEISEALRAGLDRGLLQEIGRSTVGDIKQVLLSRDGPSWIERYRPGLSSEVIAGIAKIMSDEELGQVCSAVFNPLPGAGMPIGAAGHFGSRIQPNSPGDNEEEILFSILEGLSYGCGDVIIGLNPASDEVESVVCLEELLRRVVEGLKLP